jgi:uncharacterized protein (TIRG00374 family)
MMRRTFFSFLKIAVSGLLLYFGFRFVDVASVKNHLSNVDPFWLALIVPILGLQTALLTWRWKQIAAHCGATLSLQLALRFSVIAVFFNQTLPSSMGGDAVRIWLVSRQADWRAAIYSVFLDRLVGLVSLSAFVLICLPWTLELVREPIGRTALLLLGLGSLSASAVFVAFSCKRLRFLQHWSVSRHAAELAGVALSILRSPHSFVPVFGISVLIHFCTTLIAWCAALAVGAQMPLLYAIFLIPPVILVTIVPISIAGWGVREGAMIAAFGYAGLPQGDGLMVSLLFGLSYLALGAVGGVTWIFTPQRREYSSNMTLQVPLNATPSKN